jgi:hypothetical protein
MSQPLKKQQIIALFGDKAAAKLFALLEPCCTPLSFRFEVTCKPDGSACIDAYVTSSIALDSVVVQVLFLGADTIGIAKSVTANAGEEVYVGQDCSKDVIPPGQYIGSGLAFIPGVAIVPQQVTVVIPECPIAAVLVLTSMNTGEFDGLWQGSALNVYGGTVQLQKSADGISSWIDAAIPANAAPAPYTGPLAQGPIEVLTGIFYRLAGIDVNSNPVYSNVFNT